VNDLYLNGGKVGGVLCESEIQGEDIRVFIGVGLNITSGVYASLGENLGLVGGEYLIEHIYSALRD
jgi:biotin-(acetyl-CoA carboxylase) ligase